MLKLAVLLVLVAGGGLVVYRATYGNFPWKGDPDRLALCGRTYYRGEIRNPEARLYRVGRAPAVVGHTVYSEMPPAEMRKVEDGGACGLTVWLRLDGGRYRGYALSGGP